MADHDEDARNIAVGAAGSALATVTQAAAMSIGLGSPVAAGLSIFAGAVPAIIRNGFTRR